MTCTLGFPESFQATGGQITNYPIRFLNVRIVRTADKRASAGTEWPSHEYCPIVRARQGVARRNRFVLVVGSHAKLSLGRGSGVQPCHLRDRVRHCVGGGPQGGERRKRRLAQRSPTGTGSDGIGRTS